MAVEARPVRTASIRPWLRVAAGGALVAAASHAQMSGAWPAFVIGAGAPATIRGLLSGVEVRVNPPPGYEGGSSAMEELKPAEEEGINENTG
jgi:hypothetical protein